MIAIASAPKLDPEGISLIAPGLYALGSAIKIDERVSWIPRGTTGYQATRCYLLETDGEWTIVDPGLRVQEDLLTSQIEQLIGPGAPISIFLTRSEPDCFGCLEAIHANFEIVKVMTGGGHNPFDGFEQVSAAGRGASGDVVPIAREGKLTQIRLGAGRELHVLHAPLRLNSTFWIYDTATRTLFSSDAFSYSIGNTFDDAMSLDEGLPFTVEDARSHLTAKFWWMETANTSSVKRGLKEIFDQYRIENICPSHGRPIIGPKAVQLAYDLTQQALSLSPQHHV